MDRFCSRYAAGRDGQIKSRLIHRDQAESEEIGAFLKIIYERRLVMMKLPPKRIPKYMELKKRDTDGKNIWFMKCQRGRVPCVTVLVRRTLADVEWDCISLPLELQPAVRGDRDLESILIGVIDTVRQKHSFSARSAFCGIITRVPIEHARSAAKAINWHLQIRVRRYKVKLWRQEYR